MSRYAGAATLLSQTLWKTVIHSQLISLGKPPRAEAR